MTPAILKTRGRKNRTSDDRRQIAVGWRSSGLNQTEYAGLHAIRPRTLRLWLREHAPELESAEEVRATAQDVLDALRRAAALLEGVLGQVADSDRSADRSEFGARAQPAPVPTVKKFSFD